MGHPFARRKDGSVRARFSDLEASVLRRVADDVAEAATEESDTTRRLFPPAYPDDAERQESYREMTHEDLVRSKQRAAERVTATLDEALATRAGAEVTLDDEATQAWLRVLNDARLVLGTTLDITEDHEHVPLPESDPRAAAYNLYLYLSALQEALLDELPR